VPDAGKGKSEKPLPRYIRTAAEGFSVHGLNAIRQLSRKKTNLRLTLQFVVLFDFSILKTAL
jgi:hypothetical protein